MENIFFAIVILVVAGILQFLVSNEVKKRLIMFFNSFASILLLIPVINTLLNGGIIKSNFQLNPIVGNLAFTLDSLSAFFLFVIGFVSFLGTFYSFGYLKPYIEKGKSISSHLFLFNLFISSMILVVLSQNVLFFLISWEIMSLSSFLLMIFEHEKKEVRKIGINYLIKMHICVLFLIVGFILLNIKTGSLYFLDYKNQISDLVFILLFLGFGIKSGIVPVHTWLPKAHPVAPTHISALMSGVMIKTGIYGILRVISLYEIDFKVAYFVLLIGLLSAFFGILYSIAQRNYKKMLAYSSIENIGIICIGIGVGMLGIHYQNNLMTVLGFLGALMHVLNHSLFKSLLFMSVGCVYSKVHTKNMEKLGGIIKKMPCTSILFLIGALGISAIPPFNGFISEFLIYLGFLKSFETQHYFLTPIIIVSIAILAFVGAMALISFTNAFSIIFLGSARTDAVDNIDKDSDKIMLIPMGILALCILFVGLFPQYAVKLVEKPISSLVSFLPNFNFDVLAIISKFNLLFFFILSVILGLRYFALKNKTVSVEDTWGCGYDKANTKMQYSANSYTRPFLGFLTPFYVRKLEFKQIKVLFPERTTFNSNIKDIFNVYFIEPIVKANDWIVKRFYWIQSGNTQVYLLYGVIFLIITMVCLFGGLL